MTDNEIVKALECKKEEIICAVADENKATHFVYNEDALDLINRLQAENELLQAKCEGVQEANAILREYNETAKAEAYKECIEKVKESSRKTEIVCSGALIKTNYSISAKKLDNLLKELVGDNNG